MESMQLSQESDINIFSTYGLVTAKRLLDRYKIRISEDDLKRAIHNEFSFYHRILQIPLKNVLNGIILQQAMDYHSYLQKLFIDYLLSPEATKGSEEQGASTRNQIEDERTQLISLGDDFNQVQMAHKNKISSSQQILIRIAADWNAEVGRAVAAIEELLKSSNTKIKKTDIELAVIKVMSTCNLSAIGNGGEQLCFTVFCQSANVDEASLGLGQLIGAIEGLITYSETLDQSIVELTDEVNSLSHVIRSYRTQFYEFILRVLDLVMLLPDYKIDEVKDLINRESLYFDKSIGNPV